MPKGNTWDKLVNADKGGGMDLMKISQTSGDPKGDAGSLKVWATGQKNRLKKKAKELSFSKPPNK